MTLLATRYSPSLVKRDRASRNFYIIRRRGVCARTRSWRSTGRVVSTSWARWLAREISTCLKCDAPRGGCRRKTNCTATRMSQVGSLTLTDASELNRKLGAKQNRKMDMAFHQNWYRRDIIKRTAQPKLSFAHLLHSPKLTGAPSTISIYHSNWVSRVLQMGRVSSNESLLL